MSKNRELAFELMDDEHVAPEEKTLREDLAERLQEIYNRWNTVVDRVNNLDVSLDRRTHNWDGDLPIEEVRDYIDTVEGETNNLASDLYDIETIAYDAQEILDDMAALEEEIDEEV